MPRLTARERLLLSLFLGALFLLGNVILWSALLGRNARLQADLAAKRSAIQSMRALAAEAEKWSARDAWLNAVQPGLTNPEQAGVQLLDEIKAVARANEVLLEGPELGSVETEPARRSVFVQITAKSSWASLVKFLHAVQGPERFVVFETADFQVDPANASRMICRFKIAKWYAL